MFTKSRRTAAGLTVSLALAVGLALTGCGAVGNAAHEVAKAQHTSPSSSSSDAAKSDAPITKLVAAAQPAVAKLQGDTYSKVTITASGADTLVYTYTYKTAVDAPTAAKYFDGQLDTFQDSLDDAVFPTMKTAGIPSPQATYTYLNPDGSTVWSHTFQQS